MPEVRDGRSALVGTWTPFDAAESVLAAARRTQRSTAGTGHGYLSADAISPLGRRTLMQGRSYTMPTYSRLRMDERFCWRH